MFSLLIRDKAAGVRVPVEPWPNVRVHAGRIRTVRTVKRSFRAVRIGAWPNVRGCAGWQGKPFRFRTVRAWVLAQRARLRTRKVRTVRTHWLRSWPNVRVGAA